MPKKITKDIPINICSLMIESTVYSFRVGKQWWADNLRITGINNQGNAVNLVQTVNHKKHNANGIKNILFLVLVIKIIKIVK